ncbi:pyridoxal phosphate-dependent decarboxylase family protein [Streptomyces sp. LN245]|uniref:pyridoxal phosphate-dependent decarboxylase family protein n=1 Tax=Streptomyces sp. LN245 TaxID=3112975 RepID=UPI003714E740
MTTPQQTAADAPAAHPGLPETGRSGADLLAELAVLTAADLPTRGGNTTAYVYDSGRPEVREAAERAYLTMMEVNGLDPTAFPSIVALERQVVGATATRLGGDDTTPGIFTSGGTESIILAVKAARDARPDVLAPEIVVPVTAHAAFHKAGSYLRVTVRSAPVDPVTYRADPAAMAALCNENTVLVVASAPSYAHGVIDPVAEIAADAAGRGIPCHVDACVGGWLLPWLAEACRARPGLRPLRPRRHLPLLRPAQVRLRPQGRLRPAVPRRGPASRRLLRLRHLARLQRRQLHDPEQQGGRSARRGVGHPSGPRRRRLPRTGPRRPVRDPDTDQRRPGDRRPHRPRHPRGHPGRHRHRSGGRDPARPLRPRRRDPRPGLLPPAAAQPGRAAYQPAPDPHRGQRAGRRGTARRPA